MLIKHSMLQKMQGVIACIAVKLPADIGCAVPRQLSLDANHDELLCVLIPYF